MWLIPAQTLRHTRHRIEIHHFCLFLLYKEYKFKIREHACFSRKSNIYTTRTNTKSSIVHNNLLVQNRRISTCRQATWTCLITAHIHVQIMGNWDACTGTLSTAKQKNQTSESNNKNALRHWNLSMCTNQFWIYVYSVYMYMCIHMYVYMTCTCIRHPASMPGACTTLPLPID